MKYNIYYFSQEPISTTTDPTDQTKSNVQPSNIDAGKDDNLTQSESNLEPATTEPMKEGTLTEQANSNVEQITTDAGEKGNLTQTESNLEPATTEPIKEGNLTEQAKSNAEQITTDAGEKGNLTQTESNLEPATTEPIKEGNQTTDSNNQPHQNNASGDKASTPDSSEVPTNTDTGKKTANTTQAGTPHSVRGNNPIWKDFTVEITYEVQGARRATKIVHCNYCKRKLTLSEGSTTPMRNHLW